MPRIIAVANQKGGVGKTTTCLSLGAALAELGYKVLLVDADPQGSLTLSCGINPDELSAEETLYGTLSAMFRGDSASTLAKVTKEIGLRLQLVASNIELSQADVDIPREPLGVLILRDALAAIREQYDYILVDCPPNLGPLTVSALSAADSTIVPMQADYLAMKGLDLLLQTVAKVQSRINKRLLVEGVLLTMGDQRTAHSREVAALTRKRLAEEGIPIFSVEIKMSVRLKEAPMSGESILGYASKSTAADAYRELAKELQRW